jgi:hypothetical protein
MEFTGIPRPGPSSSAFRQRFYQILYNPVSPETDVVDALPPHRSRNDTFLLLRPSTGRFHFIVMAGRYKNRMGE